jgi:hypothetical protein
MLAPPNNVAPALQHCLYYRVVDPDPDWIWIQRVCGSGSVLGIRMQEIKKFQWKMHFFAIKKKLPLKRNKIALTTF